MRYRLILPAFLGAALVLALNCRPSWGQSEPGEVAPPAHDVYGTVVAARGDALDLRLRTGKIVLVDLHQARALHRLVLLTPGRPVHVRGNPGRGGFAATAVLKSHADSALWPTDK